MSDQSTPKTARAFDFTVPKLKVIPIPDRPSKEEKKKGIGQVDYFDTRERGLELRVSYSGSKTFRVKAKVMGGRPKSKSLGKFSPNGIGEGITLAEARQAAQAFKGEYAGGRDVVAEIRGEREERGKAPTVNEVIDIYLERHCSELRTQRSYRDILIGSDLHRRTGIGPKTVSEVIGDKLFRDVKRRDIVALMDNIVDRGHDAMANRVHDVIRHMFGWAIRREIDEDVEYSVAENIDRRPKVVRKRWLSDNEISSVWSILDDQCVPDVALIYRLLAVTGLRENSVITMRWEDLDFENAEWRIPAEYMKADSRNRDAREFLMPMSTMFLDIMKGMKQTDETWVFPTGTCRGKVSKSGHRSRSSFANYHPKIVEAAGVEHFRFHDFRRTIDTHMGQLGITRFDRDRVLAHKDSSVAGRHYDLYDYREEKHRALEAWAYKLYWLTGQTPPSALLARLKKWRFADRWDERPWNLAQWDQVGDKIVPLRG